MEKINVDLYGGKGLFGGKEVPLEADEIFCNMYDKCSFYKEDKCLRCRSFISPTCKYGKNIITKGYTSRASKYYDFKNKYNKDEKYNVLSHPCEKAAVIGDYLFLKTNYVLVRKKKDTDDKWLREINGYVIFDGGFGNSYVFLPLNEVSNELLYAIFSKRPQALMGGIIGEYQNKIVPDILQTLRKVAPLIHKEFVKEYPEYDIEPNYIGKKAYISSLKSNTIFKYEGKEWLFDGEYVIAENFDIGMGSPWWLSDGTKAYVKIKVNDKMLFTVEDNSIIDENTKFE